MGCAGTNSGCKTLTERASLNHFMPQFILANSGQGLFSLKDFTETTLPASEFHPSTHINSCHSILPVFLLLTGSPRPCFGLTSLRKVFLALPSVVPSSANSPNSLICHRIPLYCFVQLNLQTHGIPPEMGRNIPLWVSRSEGRIYVTMPLLFLELQDNHYNSRMRQVTLYYFTEKRTPLPCGLHHHPLFSHVQSGWSHPASTRDGNSEFSLFQGCHCLGDSTQRRGPHSTWLLSCFLFLSSASFSLPLHPTTKTQLRLQN